MEKRSGEKIIPLEIYTDGSLKKIGKKATFGGWAYCVIQDNKEIACDSGCEPITTNQRMELIAVIEGLKFAENIRKKSEKVIIYSDSAYIINCYLKEWYINWQENGWMNANKQPVKNIELWQEIIPYFDNFWYSFRKVEGHSGNLWNEKADTLAQFEAEQLKRKWRG